MLIKSKSGHLFELPTDEEEIAINAAIASDSDTYELSDAQFSELRPVGRPVAEVTKERITIRLSREVTDYFRATGKGWQTRIDDILLEYIASRQ
ncbi:MAG: BrnA antitoxin family protein [Ardenticatenaceae bacterium]|nr:BrnA antitoxin family protein [Ardenticatenaceae bacterium]